MFYLKFNVAMIFVIVFLSHKAFSPKKDITSSLSTQSKFNTVDGEYNIALSLKHIQKKSKNACILVF